ncbi:hypothetical protein BSLA_02r1757 [Burkholderia stabilis]|nr:hypothetical protein BSLA_02r1757 [Burkholderia stabilis]
MRRALTRATARDRRAASAAMPKRQTSASSSPRCVASFRRIDDAAAAPSAGAVGRSSPGRHAATCRP